MASTPQRHVYRAPLRKKGIMTVPQEVRKALGDEEDVIFEWEPQPDGSYRVTPLGTHKIDVAWFYQDTWLEHERLASEQAERNEGKRFANPDASVEFLKQRIDESLS